LAYRQPGFQQRRSRRTASAISAKASHVGSIRAERDALDLGSPLCGLLCARKPS